MTTRPIILWCSHNASTATGTDYLRLMLPAKNIGKVAGDTGITNLLGTDLAQIGYNWIADNGITHIVVSRTLTRFAQFHEQVQQMVRDLQDAGVRLIVDIDDCPHVPTYHVSHAEQQAHGTARHVVDTLAMADVIWCSTEALKDHLGRYTRVPMDRLTVVGNGLNPDEWQHTHIKVASASKVLFGVMANATHHHNLPLLDDVFRKLRHSGKGQPWHVVACGVHESNRETVMQLMGLRPDEVTFRPWVHPSEHPEHYRHFHVLLAPLLTDYYNACRSDLKVHECAMSNTGLLGSPVGGQALHLSHECTDLLGACRKAVRTRHIPVPGIAHMTALEDANRLRMRTITGR